MALINIDTAIKRIMQIINKLEPPQGVEILTYKRNRGLSLIREQGDRVVVRERGYAENHFEVDVADLPKLLKSIAKREFPRSRKVRIYQLAGADEAGQARKKL